MTPHIKGELLVQQEITFPLSSCRQAVCKLTTREQIGERVTLLRGIHASLLASVITASAHAADPDKKEIGFGATAGPYVDQIRYGIKPLLEKEGCKVAIVEFTDYVQPNLALADGALDANAFQHETYLKKFLDDHKLPLSQLVKVPTAPIGIYSHKSKSLADVKDGATVSLPNDVTSQACAILQLQ
jgi:D-methionine transport system substrate-binding protein